MRKGFTVLELLVASLLLGMLMTILTMIFNQSSIAWRTGVAGVADLDDSREAVSDVRYKADNAYMWKGEHCIHSVFDDGGDVLTSRDKYIDEDFGMTGKLELKLSDNDDVSSSYGTGIGCGTGDKSSSKNYIVNVMSAGPDRDEKTRYDNIYSVPYDPNNWNW